MSREVKNTTLANIFIDDIGVNVEPGETFEIDHASYDLWATSEDIDAYINSGDLRFLLLGEPILPVDALKVIHELSPFTIIKEQGGTSVTVKVVKTLEVDGLSLVVTDLGDSKAQLYSDPFGGGDNRLMFVECDPDHPGCIRQAYPIMDSGPCYLEAKEC